MITPRPQVLRRNCHHKQAKDRTINADQTGLLCSKAHAPCLASAGELAVWRA